MRERAVIHVAGPRGAGKTTFIEAILGDTGAFVLAARCIRDDALRQSRETAPRAHPELRRYREAGATGAGLFAFPEADIGSDAFFVRRLMEDYSQAAVLEGDNPLEFVDLAVFVAPAPAAGETLFVRHKRDRAKQERAKADAIERLLRRPDGVAPLPTEHWAVAGAYAGVEHAQLVVVNIHTEAERQRGEQLVADVGRLRKDAALFDDILGSRGSKIPVTAVVANLVDPEDRGRKKALARARRALRARS